MAAALLDKAVEAITTVIIILAVMVYKALALGCEWAEVLILMKRWMARQASAKWIPTTKDSLELIAIVAENLAYDLRDCFTRAWTFRKEIINMEV